MILEETICSVFIHGNSTSSDVFRDILESPSLAGEKRAIQLPGHKYNRSPVFGEHDFTVEAYKKYILEVVRDLSKPVLLVGNSLGGHLAIEAAHEIEDLAGLVIFGAPPVKKPINFDEAMLPSPVFQTFLNEQPTKEEVEKVFDAATANKSVIQSLTDDFFEANPIVRRVLAEELMQGKWSDQRMLFDTLDVPKYIIVGEQDPFVNPSYLENVAGECPTRCTLYPIERCGHYPSIERPDIFIQTIDSILEDCATL